jgi:hypothetical protein
MPAIKEMNLSELVDLYGTVNEETKLLEARKDAARRQILFLMKSGGYANHVTPEFIAQINSRETKSIKVDEAQQILPPEVFGQLVHIGTSFVLTVKKTP